MHLTRRANKRMATLVVPTWLLLAAVGSLLILATNERAVAMWLQKIWLLLSVQLRLSMLFQTILNEPVKERTNKSKREQERYSSAMQGNTVQHNTMPLINQSEQPLHSCSSLAVINCIISNIDENNARSESEIEKAIVSAERF